MEQIKITDKLTLRQEALKMAVMHAEHSDFTEQIIRAAKTYESYLKGSAELPEYSDHDKFYTEILAKMQESFKPKPISMWISADSEMKPYDNANVLVICKDYGDSPLLAEYLGKDNWDVFDADVTKNTLHGEIEVLAWMPIPPFSQPTL